MPPRHFSPYYRFTTPLNSSSFTHSYNYHFNFVQISTFYCLSIYDKDHSIQTLNVGFINRLSTYPFSNLFRWKVFLSQQMKNMLVYYLETSVVTCDYQTYHCRKDYLLCKKVLNCCLKGNFPFSVHLRPVIQIALWWLFL